MTTQQNSDSSISSIGNPIMNSTVIARRYNLDDTGLPLPSFLTDPDESDAEDTPQPRIPNLSDYQLPSFLLNTSAATPQSLHISALLSDDTHTAAVVPPPPVTTAAAPSSPLPPPTPPPTPTSPLTAALATAITTTASSQPTSSSSTTVLSDNTVTAANPPVLSFIKGRKGGTQACYGGFVYTYDRRKNDGTIYWQCKSRAAHSPRCTGRLYTQEKASVKRQTPHSHQPSEREVLRSTAISNIKFDSSTTTPANVLRETLATTPADIKAILPAAYLLKKQIRSHRAKQRIAPSTASAASDIVIPENYKLTAAGNTFLQADIITGRGKRVLIFSTDLVFDFINTSSIDTFFADGTFKVAPPQFTQCWILRAKVGRHTNLPILYALLEDKHHTSYAAVMEFLQRRCPLFNPVTTIVDFETAEHKAILSVFAHTTLRGCLFHFCQCQLKQFKGVPFITTDEVLRSLLYSVFGLPFLPLNDVVNAWTELKTRLWYLYPTPKISEYIAYFERNWLLSAVYPPSLWNISSAVEYDEPRTNNASEGGNNALNAAFSSTHPSIWVFIETLSKFHSETELKYLQISAGGQPTERPKKQWRVREEKLKRLVANYDPNAKMDFCRCIGYNYY